MSKTVLFDFIYNLPKKQSEIKSPAVLISQIVQIKETLRLTSPEQIERICKENNKLIYIAKILMLHYFGLLDIKSNETDLDVHTKTVSSPNLHLACFEKPILNNEMELNLQRKSSIRMIVHQEHVRYSKEEKDRLRFIIMGMFNEMLVSQKMVQFLVKINVRLYMHFIIVDLFSSGLDHKREVQRCLKFVYLNVKLSHKSIPNTYGGLITKLLKEGKFESAWRRDTQVKFISFNYLFDTAILLTEKHLELSVRCGLLETLYNLALEGRFSLQRVKTVTELIIALCLENKSRKDVLETIHIGRTFAIFTNFDYLVKSFEPNSEKREAISRRLIASTVMIDMFLESFSILTYLIQEGRTLQIFMSTLKKKRSVELSDLIERILSKIVFRIYNFSKSLNFGQSMFLILKGLMFLHSQIKDQQQFEKIFSFLNPFGNLILAAKSVMKQYFPNLFERQLPLILFETLTDRQYSKELTDGLVKMHINVQAFCEEGILPFQFTIQELRSQIIFLLSYREQTESIYGKMEAFLDQLQNEPICSMGIMETFYTIVSEAVMLLPWESKYLSVSTYMAALTSRLEGNTVIDQIRMSRLKALFDHQNQEESLEPTYHLLSINQLSSIGFFCQSNKYVMEFIKLHLAQKKFFYLIGRILLSLEIKIQKNSIHQKELLHQEICSNGSPEIVLQIIEIMKCQFYINKCFSVAHMSIIFDQLIYSEKEDILLSVTELLEQIVMVNNSLQANILSIDLTKITNQLFQKRLSYLFLNDQSGISKIKTLIPNFLRDELQNWTKKGNNLTKQYYFFMSKELKIISESSSKNQKCYSLGFKPQSYRKLIYLPWNICINERFFPAFVEYKNIQKNLILKIYPNRQFEEQINFQGIYIGKELYITDQNYRVTQKLKEVSKVFQKQLHKQNKQIQRILLQRGNLRFVIAKDSACAFILEKVIVKILLSEEVYRPLKHPLNFINVLSSTKEGIQFLRREKFIPHCLELINHALDSLRESKELFMGQLEESKGALICLGTICCSRILENFERIQVYEIIHKIWTEKLNIELQEISLWLVNILVKDEPIRKKIKEEKSFLLLPTNKSGWLCLPNYEHCERVRRSHSPMVNFYKNSLPDKKSDIAFAYLYNQLNKIQELDASKQTVSKICCKTVDNTLLYLSLMDFPFSSLQKVFKQFVNYFLCEKFEKDFPSGVQLP